MFQVENIQQKDRLSVIFGEIPKQLNFLSQWNKSEEERKNLLKVITRWQSKDSGSVKAIASGIQKADRSRMKLLAFHELISLFLQFIAESKTQMPRNTLKSLETLHESDLPEVVKVKLIFKF